MPRASIVKLTSAWWLCRPSAISWADRLAVNASGTFGTFGLETGLPLSMTLGCGTFGGTSTTDSVTYRHLLNIKRLAYRTLD